ncbi:MAG: DUF4040 domain-containing protein [Firmicutes bacterium]|nr:DUF4040 domain-containing protein [Bacillota bacterium]
MTYVYYLFLGFMILTALFSILYTNLLNALVCFSLFNLAMVVVFLLLQAPDVAMAEAVIGLGLTTALFIVAVSRTRERAD